jgi:hypothetical protein
MGWRQTISEPLPTKVPPGQSRTLKVAGQHSFEEQQDTTPLSESIMLFAKKGGQQVKSMTASGPSAKVTVGWLGIGHLGRGRLPYPSSSVVASSTFTDRPEMIF